MLEQKQDLTAALSHVLWICGSPCAGKSSIAHNIARIRVFVGYYLDPLARNHFKRRVAAGDTEAATFLQMSMDQRWLLRTPEELLEEALVSWTREFELAVEDLLALPREQFIVAEGNFFPSLLAPLLSDPHQAICLAPTAAFCEKIRKERFAVGNSGVVRTSDPQRALRNIIARDCLLAQHVKRQAEEVGIACYEIDGSRSLDEMTRFVMEHFEPYITERLKSMPQW